MSTIISEENSKALWSQEHFDTGEVTRLTYAQVEAYLRKIGGATRKEARDQMRMVINRRLTYIASENAAFRRGRQS